MVILVLQIKLFLTDTTDEILDSGDVRDKDSLQLFEQPADVAPTVATVITAQSAVAPNNSRSAAPTAVHTTVPASRVSAWPSAAAHYSFGYDSAPEPAAQGMLLCVNRSMKVACV